MPLISDRQLTGLQTLPERPPMRPDPSVGEVVGAAFRLENSVGSWLTNETSFQNYTTEEGFDPFEGDHLKGYEAFADGAIEINSSSELAAWKQQVDKEINDRQVLAAGGVSSFVAMASAGLTDPLYWPFFAWGAGTIGSKTALQAAFTLGAMGGMSEIPAEIAKQQLQETRTSTDAMMAIGGATVLSGILGGAVKLLSKSDTKALAGKMDDMLFSEDAPMVAGNTKSMGAAEAVTLTKDELSLVSAGGLERLELSPLLVAENSPSLKVRQLSAEMMESASVKQAHLDGKITMPEGGAIETRIKSWDANLGQSILDVRDLYTQYRGDKVNIPLVGGAITKTRRLISSTVGHSEKLTYKQFREAVGYAAVHNDKSPIPQVQAAVEAVRKQLIDPLKDAAIDARLLPPDVQVTTAASYLMRVYNQEKIIAQRPQWNAIVEGWLKSNQRAASRFAKPNTRQALDAGLTDLEIKNIAEDITNHITGAPAGRIPYDVVPNVRGPLKERVFTIPDELIESYLERDIDLVSRKMTRTMAPDIELSRMYGNADMKQELLDIGTNYNELMNAATTESARMKLGRQWRQDDEVIKAMRDRLRGTYLAPEHPDNFFIRANEGIRSLNFLRMLGGMTLSAIPDLSRPVSVNGLRPVARAMRALATSPHRFKQSVAEAKRFGVAWDMVLNSRAVSLAELGDVYGRHSGFERGLAAGSDVFGKVSLMTPWNASLRSFTGVVTQDRILAAVMKATDGTASQSTLKRLALSGIGTDQIEAIALQYKKYGSPGVINLSNGHLWDDKTTLDIFKHAVLKDVDRAIIVPGAGEKPLWFSTQAGKMISQFKTFAAASHHKILLADMQLRDAQALNGFMLAVALGTVAYGSKEYVAGREISTDPKKLIVESLDRSGVFGYFWDVNNIVEKMTRGEVGVNKLIGAPPMSRYASRNVLGAVLGPSAGTFGDAALVVGGVSSGEFGKAELRATRKLLPGQNLFYMRRLLNHLETEIGEEL